MGGPSMQDESIEALASKLPEGDALPDGFSEGLTETVTEANANVNVSRKMTCSVQEDAILMDETSEFLGLTGSASEDFSDATPNVHQMSDLTIGSQIYSSDSNEISIELNEHTLSPCSSMAERRVEKRDKPRRFPVQLSEKENSTITKLNTDKNVGVCNESPENTNQGAGCEIATIFDASTNLSPKLPRTFLEEEHASEIQGSKVGDSDARHSSGEDDQEKTTRTRKHELDNEEETLDKKCLVHAVQQRKCETSSQDLLKTVSGKVHAPAKANLSIKNGDILLGIEGPTLRREYEQMKKERDIAKAESAKALCLREKLESLCRELQRQNKQLTDECKRITLDEQQKRLDLSNRFHNTIKDVTAKLEEQANVRLQQTKDNEMLREKLNHFIQQYELREKQYGQQLKAKSLELQLSEVKLKQQEELVKQEESKNRLCTEQIAQLLRNEQDLRAQLTLCGDNFEQFQDTLAKSNEVFTSYKKEIEKMSKTIKILEKENVSLKKKCKEYDMSLIDLLDERKTLKKQLETKSNQKEKLEALCRSLQAERKHQNFTTVGVAASAATVGAAAPGATTENTEQIELVSCGERLAVV